MFQTVATGVSIISAAAPTAATLHSIIVAAAHPTLKSKDVVEVHVSASASYDIIDAHSGVAKTVSDGSDRILPVRADAALGSIKLTSAGTVTLVLYTKTT